MRAELLTAEDNLDVAVNDIVPRELSEEERKSAVGVLTKRISNEARMRKEILKLRDHVRILP